MLLAWLSLLVLGRTSLPVYAQMPFVKMSTLACDCELSWSVPEVPSCVNQSGCPSQSCQEEMPLSWCIARPGCDHAEDFYGQPRFYCERPSGSSVCPANFVLANVRADRPTSVVCQCVPEGALCFRLGSCEPNPHCELFLSEECVNPNDGNGNPNDGDGNPNDGNPNDPPGGGDSTTESPGSGSDGPGTDDGPGPGGPGPGGPGSGPGRPPRRLQTDRPEPCKLAWPVPTRPLTPEVDTYRASGFRIKRLNTQYFRGDEGTCGTNIFISEDWDLKMACESTLHGRQAWVITVMQHSGAPGETRTLAASVEACYEGESTNPPESSQWNELEDCEPTTRPSARLSYVGRLPFYIPRWEASEKQALWGFLQRVVTSEDMNSPLTELALSSDFVGADAFNPCSTLARSVPGFECFCNVAVYAMSFTGLNDHLPPEIGLLSGLSKLRIQRTRARGAGVLPSSITNLTRLHTLRLETMNGALAGKLPEDIGDLRNLASLVIQESDMSGALPASLGDLQFLQYLELSDNKFSGTVPDKLFTMPLLREVDLSKNELSVDQFTKEKLESLQCLDRLILSCPTGTYMQLIPNTTVSNTPSINTTTERSGGPRVVVATAIEDGDGNVNWRLGDKHCVECPFAMTSGRDARTMSGCYCDTSFRGITAYSTSQTCGCLERYYLDRVNKACLPCPVGLDCDWDQNGTASLQPPVALPGYWVAPVDSHSSFTGHEVYLCHSKLTCIGGSVCATGRRGTACHACFPGWHGGPDGECEECVRPPRHQRLNFILAGLAMVPLMVPVAQILRSTKQRKFSRLFRRFRVALRQLLKYFQLLMLISGFSINWPLEVDAFWRIVKMFSLNFYFSLGCMAEEQTVQLEMAMRWLLPVAFALLSCLMVPFSRFLRFALRHCPWQRLRGYADSVAVSFMDVLILDYFAWTVFFASMLSTSIRLLTCRDDPMDKLRVVDFPQLECYRDEVWVRLLPGTILSVVLYVFAYLLTTWWLLRLVRKELTLTGGASRGDWFFVCDGFRTCHVKWPLAMAAKDVAVNIMSVAFARDGTSQVLASAFVIAVYMFFLLKAMPFGDESLNVMEIWSMGSVLCTLFFAGGLGNNISVAELVDVGLEEAAMFSRAIWMLSVMMMGLIVPAMVMFYQLALLVPCVANRLPLCLLPQTPEERSARLSEIEAKTGQIPLEFRRVLEGMDDIEWQRFDKAISTASSATVAGITPTESKILGMVRIRTSSVGSQISSGSFPEMIGRSTNNSVEGRDDDEECPPEGTNSTTTSATSITPMKTDLAEDTQWPHVIGVESERRGSVRSDDGHLSIATV